MRKIIFISVKIVVALAILSYCLFLWHYRDLTGVFNIDKHFRTETKYIVVHHDNINRECTLKEIEDYHRDSLGWQNTGFAYNIYIKDGKVYQMHELNGVGAATLSYNQNTIAVCVHTADKHQLSTQIALILTLRFLMSYYGISKEQIKGHCDLNSTKCPELDLENLKKWL